MSLLRVDYDKCKKDGICVEVCPARIIEIREKDAFPTLIASGDSFCISCGHCVAVCPHGAMSHTAMASQDCEPVKRDLFPTSDQVGQFLRGRRSIRVYKEKPVDRSQLTELIDIARYAPSGTNMQPVKWLVIDDQDEITRLVGLVVDWMQHLIDDKSPLAVAMNLERIVAAWRDGMDRICRGAPVMVVAHAKKNDRSAPAACTIALTYFELATISLGLSGCWAGYFNAAANFWDPMHKALNLPEGNVSFGAMMVGYPKYQYHRIPKRNDPDITWR
jgi:nitroreductase/NAD-dependent dihydropyrimidine dehydrogenase PreA subunit